MKRLSWRALFVACTIALVWQTGICAPVAQAPVAHQIGDLADTRINESSGLAASRRLAGCLWTHNDSGDSARVFLLSPRGETLAEVALRGAQARDWEDIAVAGDAKNAQVYVGDIGDNLKARAEISVYRFRETAIRFKSTPKNRNARAPRVEVVCERQALIYPDGAHDAETLLATPDGRLLIVTKDLRETLLFITPHHFQNGARQTLKLIGSLKIGGVSLWSRLVTGGDLSPNGKRLVLRTYTYAHEWTLDKADDIGGNWWKRAPISFALPQTPQGEAICFSADGKRWLTTSEKTPTPLWEITPPS